MNVSAEDLIVRNDTLGSMVDTTNVGFSYDAPTRTATWDFGSLSALDAAFYTFELSETIDVVVGDLALDGGPHTEIVHVAIPGDANLDGRVDVFGDGFALLGNIGLGIVRKLLRHLLLTKHANRFVWRIKSRFYI